MKRLTGTVAIARFILRRDRIVLPLWAVWLAVLPMITLSAFRELYPSEAQIETAARGFGSNPAFLAMFGPVFRPNLGSLTAWRLSIVFIVIGVVSLLTVIRHTRVEEETGRRELIGAAVVGRHAPLAAALLVIVGVDLAVGLVSTIGLIGLGQPVAGSVAFGTAFALSGVVFAGVGALAAQLTANAGAARGIALSALGLAYVTRAAGDAGDAGWLLVTSPFAWAQRLRPYAGEQWWIALPLLALALALVWSAVALSARRDVGSGVLEQRPGPAVASPRLGSPFGLAWRIHRGLLFGWAAGFAVLGAVYGSVAEGVGDLLRDNPELRDIFERMGGVEAQIIDLYLAAVMGVLGLIGAAYAIQAALRPRVEEESQRAEPVLATAVERVRWMGGHLVFAFAGPIVVLGTAGAAIGLTYGAASGDVGGQVARNLAAALVQVPAVWVLVAIGLAMFGLAPLMNSSVWGIYGAVIFVSLLGAILDLGQWFLDLSPFTHVPGLPAAGFEWLPVLALTGVAAALTTVGVIGFRDRDVT
ncbi:MAG TPA: ABC transporter permease [Acidimicrobiia bacterium]|nr:ABC transporter permease [Acidimicrobiia bacterium]